MSRLRLPKEHIAGGWPLKIKTTNKGDGGGTASLLDQEVLIEQPQLNDHNAVDTLIHECLEISFVAHGVRYGNSKEEWMFVLDHRTFSIVTSELAGTVLKLLKANGYKESKDEDSN
jgi:hypothetical protein